MLQMSSSGVDHSQAANDEGDFNQAKAQAVTSWSGRIVKTVLFSASGLSFGLGSYELIAGGISVAGVSANYSNSGSYFAIAAGSYLISLSTAILGCCTSKFVAKKTLESNVERLDELDDKDSQKIRALKEEVERVNQVVRDYQSQLADSKQQIDALNAHLDGKVAEIKTTQQALQATAEKMTQFQDLIGEQKDFIEELNNENQTLQNTVDKFEKGKHKLADENHEVCIEIDRLSKEKDELKEIGEKFNAEKIVFKKIIEKLNAQIKELKEQNEQVQKDRDLLMQRLNVMENGGNNLKVASANLAQTVLKEKEISDTVDENLDRLFKLLDGDDDPVGGPSIG